MSGTIFDIGKFRIHDGDGIRTALFLKGCNLKCPWCSNPESQILKTQVSIYRTLCTKCLMCQRNCPNGAVYVENDTVKINRDLCEGCGKCTKMCPGSARRVYGQTVTVEYVMKEILKDSVYYSRSGGGVTVTGGEPLLQPEFCREILFNCRREYIDTAVETAGYVAWDAMWSALEYADTVLLDIKATNAEMAKVFLQKNSDAQYMLNRKHENIAKLRENKKDVHFRCPIIPGFNNTEEHIRAIGELAEKNDIRHVDLLPFHQFGRAKYDSLDIEYTMKDIKPMENSSLEPFREILEAKGLFVSIGG